MRDRVLAALLTLAVFGAGFGSGVWAERHRPIPRPPGAFMGEFGAKQGGAARVAPPINRAQLLEQIDRLRPEMDSFRQRVMDIYAQFDRDMDTVLTPEQRADYERKFRSKRGFGPPPRSRPATNRSRTTRSRRSCRGPSGRWPTLSSCR